MYGDGTIWYDKARKKYCYDYCDNDGKRHRKRFACAATVLQGKNKVLISLLLLHIYPLTSSAAKKYKSCIIAMTVF